MQRSSKLLIVFVVCCGLAELAAPVAINIPAPIPANSGDSTITNSVESVETTRNAGGVRSSSSSSDEPANPTSHPANCSNNSTEDSRRPSSTQSDRMSSIKKYMMAKLNLTEIPSSGPLNDEIPPEVLASYQARLQTQELRSKEPADCPDKKTTQYARTVNLFTPVQYASSSEVNKYDKKDSSKEGEGKEGLAPPPVMYNLTFENLKLATSSRLWSVVLRLYKKKLHTSSRGTNPTESVKIFQVDKNNAQKLDTLLAAKILQSEDDEYVSFDITDGVKKWRNDSTTPQTLQLSVLVDTPWRLDTRSKLPPTIAFDVPTYGKSEGRPQRPQLVVETLHREEKSAPILNHSLRRRKKRQAVSGAVNNEYCFKNPTESNCCIRNLTVNIKKDLGFNHVILPITFQPNYCNGSCSNSLWSSANLATKHLQDVRRNNPGAAAEPCCVPHTMKPLPVIMVLNNRIVVEDIPNMIVTSCICR